MHRKADKERRVAGGGGSNDDARAPWCLDLCCAGPAEIFSHLQLLESPLTQSTGDLIKAAADGDGAESIRELKSKLDSVALAYKPLTDWIVQAAESGRREFPPAALTDAAGAEAQADGVYFWARSLVSECAANPAGVGRIAKLKMMPYLVAMAYTVRVKLDACYVESIALPRPEGSGTCLERSRNAVSEFAAAVRTAVDVMLSESSLLEVALDYHLELSVYATMVVALQKSVEMLLSPDNPPEIPTQWDDGLSNIR